jgi:transcriptional regulator with XRE-family HTH domain
MPARIGYGAEDNLTDLLRRLVKEGTERHGWTQAQLAQQVGMSEKHLSRLMTGKTTGSLLAWDRLLKAVSDGDTEGGDD